MKSKKKIKNSLAGNLTKAFVETREFKQIINSTAPDIIDVWSGKNIVKKIVTKPVKSSIRKSFDADKPGSTSVIKLLNTPEVVKNISKHIPSLINLLFESFHAMSQTISEMSETEKIDVMDNIINNIDFGKSGAIWTNLFKLINDLHKSNPNYFEEKLTPNFRAWVEKFDFGELKECVDNSSEDIVNIVSMVNKVLWDYPAKFLCIFSLVPSFINIFLQSLNRTIGPLNNMPPDLIADVIFALMNEIDSESIGDTVNQANELIRKIHTGSALIGEKGNPQFPLVMKEFLSKMFKKIDLELLLKSMGKLDELKEQSYDAYIELLSENPALSKNFIQNQFKSLTASSKKLGQKTDTLEKLFSDEELAEEFSEAAIRIDTRDFAENINRFCSLLNRVHDEKPGFLKETLSKIINSFDDYEIGETTKWLTEDIVESVKPVANEVLPPIIRGLADLLSAGDKKNQDEILDAIDYFKEKVNLKGAKS